MRTAKRFLTVLALLALCLTLMAVSAFATDVVDSGTCGDNLTWELTDSGSLWIRGTGEMWDFMHGLGYGPWYDDSYYDTDDSDAGNDRIQFIFIDDGVTSIGECAFFGCDNALGVRMADSVTRIGAEAFKNCDNLSGVLMSDNVVSIGSDAFMNCVSLQSINLPSKLERILTGTFRGCRSLAEIAVPNSVTEIWDSAFSGCESLSYLSLPAGLTRVADWAFRGCTALTDVYYAGTESDWQNIRIDNNMNDAILNAKIHAGIAGVGDCGDWDGGLYWKLTGDGVMTIYGTGYWFEPEDNRDVPWYPIRDGIKKLIVSDEVESIQYMYDCDNLTEIILPDDILIWYGFSDCDGLTSLTLPTGAILSYFAFADCDGLTDVVLSDGTSAMALDCFGSCDNLKNISIPTTVTYIGWGAFDGCESLTNVYYTGSEQDWAEIRIERDNAPLLNATIHYNVKRCTVNYDADGGSGAPKAVTVAAGSKVTVSSTVPTLAGFKLKGWSLNKDGSGTIYKAGDKITVNGDMTLYAVWERIAATPKIATAENVYNGVKLTWKAASGAEKYQIYVKTASSGWKSVGYTSGTTFTWTGATSGVTYTFSVRCVSDDGKVHTSGFDSTGKTIQFIARPSIGKVENTAEGIKISWNKVPGAAKYKLVVKENGGSWKTIWNTVKDTYTWTGAESGKTYTFAIRCTTADGKSYTSAFDSTGKTIKYVAQPSINKVANTVNGVAIAWNKVPGAAKYKIVVKTATSGWKTIGYSTGSTFTWTGAESGVTYTFGIRCVTSDGKTYTSSFDSVGKSIKYVAAPQIAKLEKTSTGIKITWNKVTGAEKYKLVVKEPGGSWKTIWNTIKTSYTWTGAEKGKTYIFSIRCINADNTKYTSSWNSTGWTIKFS